MNNTKKLVTLIAVISIVLLIAIIATVVVLVTSNQNSKTEVTVNYIAVDVACNLSATYYTGTVEKDLTVDGQLNGATTLSLGPKKLTGILSPDNKIQVDKTYGKVVFEYKFANASQQVGILATLTDLSTTITKDNMELSYFVSSSEIAPANYSSMTLQDSLTTVEIAGGQTKYVYIVATVSDIYYNSNLQGQVIWNLGRL